MRGNAGERPWGCGRRNEDGGTGECHTGLDTPGVEVMETGDSWEKGTRNKKREAKHNSRILKGTLLPRRSRDTESRYAHSSEHPAKIDDQKKIR